LSIFILLAVPPEKPRIFNERDEEIRKEDQ
jgi:hypothetical protein